MIGAPAFGAAGSVARSVFSAAGAVRAVLTFVSLVGVGWLMAFGPASGASGVVVMVFVASAVGYRARDVLVMLVPFVNVALVVFWLWRFWDPAGVTWPTRDDTIGWNPASVARRLR